MCCCSLCVRCLLFVIVVVCYLCCLLLCVHRVLLFVDLLSFVILGCLAVFAMCCWLFVARRSRSLFTLVVYCCCLFLVVLFSLCCSLSIVVVWCCLLVK